MLRQKAVEWYAQMATAKGALDTASKLTGLQMDFFKPVLGLERGLTDPVTDLNMGQTAEILAYRFGLTRAQADAYVSIPE